MFSNKVKSWLFVILEKLLKNLVLNLTDLVDIEYLMPNNRFWIRVRGGRCYTNNSIFIVKPFKPQCCHQYWPNEITRDIW